MSLKFPSAIQKSYSFIILGFITILLCIQYIFAKYHYPLVQSDAIAFLPAAINYANGDGLINNVYSITRILNSNSSSALFINYPPLFPQFNGLLLQLTHNIYLNSVIIYVLLYTLATYIFYKLIPRFTWITVGLWCLILTAWSTQLNPGIGRPEALAQVWVLFFVINELFNRRAWSSFFSGVFIVLAGFTHPVSGVYGLLFYGLMRAYKGLTFKMAALSFLGSLITLLSIIVFYPYPFNKLIRGIVQHGHIVTNRGEFSLQKFIHYHFTYPEISGYFLVFIFSCFFFIYLYRKNKSSVKHLLIFNFQLILFTLSILYFTFQTIEASYNLYVLFPLYCCLIIYAVNTHFLYKKHITITVVVLFIIASAGFIRRAVLFPVHITQGVHFSTIVHLLKSYPLNEEGVSVSTSMFIPFDSMKGLTDDHTDISKNWMLVQQNYTGSHTSSDIPGFKIVLDTYSDKPIYLGSIKIANSAPGYQFVLYQRIRNN